MNRYKKLILPISIIVVCVVVVFAITANPPQTKRGAPTKASPVVVEVQQLVIQDYGVLLESFGTVTPQVQSTLVAQSAGQIVSVNEQFRDGGFFEKGDVLVKIDERDYKAQANIATANVLLAEQSLMEEQAQSALAKRNWERLGDGSQPSSLVLREPQLKAAKAALLSAQAQLQIANLSLERTSVIAPFDGRILSTEADLGQVVSTNSAIASIYASDVVEVRLPINNNDLALIELPKEYRKNTAVITNTPVLLYSDLLGQQQWQAKIVRTEGSIDSSTQQLYVVAQIDDPFSLQTNPDMPIKIGQYVTAQLKGKTLSDVIVIPNNAIYQGSYVFIVQDEVLQRKSITIRWQNGQDAVISAGLSENDLLVTTPLGQVSSGTRVQILGQN
jgi:RND family efflux transporter MFP subunit